MRSAGLKVIAGKEFRDHLQSRKFHLIFGIFLVIAVIGLIGGAVEYQKQLADYNKNQAAVSDDEFGPHPYFSWKPTILSAFNEMSMLMTTIGVILGIAMGFDLITREKESKSLKILLSHPIYRDEVINGKALGGVAAIALAMGIVLVLSLAVMLLFGIVPNFEETVRMFLFGALSFLLVFSFFAIALFMSTIAKDSGSAIIYTLIIMIVLSSLLPIFTYGSVYTAVFGQPPEPPDTTSMMRYGGYGGMYMTSASSVTISDGDGEMMSDPEVDEAWQEYEEKSRAYWEQRQAVGDAVSLLSPTSNYQRLAMAVTNPGMAQMMKSSYGPMSPDDEIPQEGFSALVALLGDMAKNIAALIITPALFFGLAWVRFMREDVR
ncbi:MAG: ABC transporter permease subunit [Methanofollis sp.]|uniref:ABC transporter permease n=1 Tax=Methanofollis sp. TaxID=2052835 RepID=UPI0026321F25|nr:ABC transporter permease subunit [Methanofollis sp.]MDD4254630.1 ABC transporter permease subunit [Methanofollis sp.]